MYVYVLYAALVAVSRLHLRITSTVLTDTIGTGQSVPIREVSSIQR